MKIQTKDLIGPALDWAVAKCEGYLPIDHTILAQTWVERKNARGVMNPCPVSSLRYSTDWAQGGPIIEREMIGLNAQYDGQWLANSVGGRTCTYGPTPLVAAMRCYVTSKLGDEVDVPEELK